MRAEEVHSREERRRISRGANRQFLININCSNPARIG
nr:MAG TPA: Putative Interleukin 2 receptor, gamma chain [Bacteriophage sp.]